MVTQYIKVEVDMLPTVKLVNSEFSCHNFFNFDFSNEFHDFLFAMNVNICSDSRFTVKYRYRNSFYFFVCCIKTM